MQACRDQVAALERFAGPAACFALASRRPRLAEVAGLLSNQTGRRVTAVSVPTPPIRCQLELNAAFGAP
jgi:hypothetical protein